MANDQPGGDMTRTASRNMGRVASCGLVALTLNLIGCKERVLQKEGVPGPDFAEPFDSATAAQIFGYVKDKLHFDDREGSSDERPLPVGCPAACREGPVVAIQPEMRTHNNGEGALKKNGRIIAKLINRDQKQDYPEYNLGAGDTVYWAVDKVKRVSNVLLEGRSLFISDQGLRANRPSAVLPRELYIDDHPGQLPDAQALARWVPRKTNRQGAAVAPAWGLGTTRSPTPTQGQTMSPLAAWNNCKSDGCCR
jgi:hypothetical protein